MVHFFIQSKKDLNLNLGLLLIIDYFAGLAAIIVTIIKFTF